ncbi:uncharacterized protein LOC142238144 [Haematobia irritans]|uniref:uncharacterized protein LOC142238144 n=1 Tax=Haematobia irritans TaxID=7368 RepID=UPI003F50C252
MDIRNFLKVKRDTPESSPIKKPTQKPVTEENTNTESPDDYICGKDIGHWLGRAGFISKSDKINLLKDHWTPLPNYDFAADAEFLKRKFLHRWLKDYAPWLVYSKKMQGALCLYCVLFPPKNVKGVLGSFAVKPFTRYQHMHDKCRSHVSNKWHIVSAQEVT